MGYAAAGRKRPCWPATATYRATKRQAAHMADPILILDTTTELRPMSRRCGRTLGGRDPLDQWAGRRDDATLAAYQAQRNTTSIDDLPALPMAPGDQQTGSG
jgi:hypothetical protein